MYQKSIIFLLVLFVALNVSAQQLNEDVFALDVNALVINKSKLKSHDVKLIPAYNHLLESADKVIAKNRIYTVMEKKQIPPSGDMHDYMSIAIYFWPDPSKADGLPYIRKDGQINPEVEDYKDKANISEMMKSVELLSLAYYFSDDKKYSKRVIEQVRAWFLDPATKMNPNFTFAQAVKGKNDGRGIGLIECREFIKVIDGIGLIKSDPSWTKKDQENIEKWFCEFLKWYTTSNNGIDEMNAKNNHGVWYDAQKLSYSLFTHHDEMAKATIKSIKQRMEKQIDTTGFFPEELARTISLHYSAFILEPLFMMANMAPHADADLWNYTSSTGRSLRKSFEVLCPYLSKEKEWFAQQIKPFEFSANATPLLAQGYYKYNCQSCVKAIYNISDKNADESILHLTTLID